MLLIFSQLNDCVNTAFRVVVNNNNNNDNNSYKNKDINKDIDISIHKYLIWIPS